jgi:hypothetical protein
MFINSGIFTYCYKFEITAEFKTLRGFHDAFWRIYPVLEMDI